AKRVRLVAVDNGSAPEVAGRLRKLAADLFGEDRLTWLSVDAPFNFATLNNRGVAACDEPHVLFLNNDVEFLSREDLAHLQGFLEWPEVGMVGGALYYPDGQLQASGIRFGPAGPEVVRDPEGGALIFREVEALTFACALARREAFVAAGMLDEVICPNGFGDALLGYRMNEAGWRILCDPAVSIRHHESKSRGSRPEELERMELDREGLPIYLYGTEFARPGQESVHRFGRSRPTWGKRIYRAVKAFRRELCG
ncbi:MAG: glycosyltransferase, partial [Puniceicoccales bacterium]